MISFEPRVSKAQTGQTSRGFTVIIPKNNDCRCRGLCFSMDKVMLGVATGLEGLIWNTWFNYILLQDINTINFNFSCLFQLSVISLLSLT